jgi:hypothetical protein
MNHQRQATARGAKRRVFRAAVLHAAVLCACGAAGVAQAFDLDTGNEDLKARWDSTARYHLGSRVEAQDDAILNIANADDGDLNFGKGSLVTNRLDMLSEFDLVWQRTFGLRFSAAGWYDQAYTRLDNTNTASASTLVDGRPAAGVLSPYTQRHAKGASAEMLDWFVFGNVDIGGVPVSARLGQHTAYGRESLLRGGLSHGVACSQNSVEACERQATPGSEAKELSRPRGGLAVQAQAMRDLSRTGQRFCNWQAVRSPESGSWLAGSDALSFGADSPITGPNAFAAVIAGVPAALRLSNAQTTPKSRHSARLGDFGISACWSPRWLDGKLGVDGYDMTDILTQLMVKPGVASRPAATCTAIGGTVLSPTTCLVNQNATTAGDLPSYGKSGTCQTAHGNSIRMYGLSLSKNVSGVSVGTELSYRFERQPGVPNLGAAVMSFVLATGLTPAMDTQVVGQGSTCPWTAVDADRQPLDGGKRMNHPLRLPPNVSVKDFWSVIVSDTQTRSMLRTDQRFPTVGSQNKALQVNADGSVDVYFGAEGAGRQGRQLGADDPGQGLVHDPAPVRSARGLVQQDRAAARRSAGAVSVQKKSASRRRGRAAANGMSSSNAVNGASKP